MNTKNLKNRIFSLLFAAGMLLLTATTAKAQTQNAMNIGGQTNVPLTADNSGNGWTWTSGSKTLNLTSSYGGDYISFNCYIGDINVSYTGSVTVNSATVVGSPCPAIYAYGAGMTITGSGGTLTLNGTQAGTPAINCGGALTIGGSAMINASTSASNSNTIINSMNTVTITDNASVTLTASGGANIYGISLYGSGNVVVNTTGTVTITSGASPALQAANFILQNGTVNLNTSSSPPFIGALSQSGGTLKVNGVIYVAPPVPGNGGAISASGISRT
jgi:hypothetical protein